MGLTEAQINKIINEDESVLHNPFYMMVWIN